MRSMPGLVPLLLLLLANPSPAQENGSASPSAPKQPVVWLLGASLTAGFADPFPRPDGERNETVKLAKVLEQIWPEDRIELRARDAAMLPMFTDVEGLGRQQVERGLEQEPSFVLALDFLFWYGYGRLRLGPGIDEEVTRLARLETGLRELARFPCPILVGDFPDMSGADPRMLHPRAIPGPAILAKLNARVGEWVAGNPRARLFKLSEFVHQAKGDGLELELDGHKHTIGPRELLQGDRLHPTVLGMAVVGQYLTAELIEMLPPKHVLRPAQVDVVELAESLGARPALEELRQRAQAGEKAQPGKKR